MEAQPAAPVTFTDVNAAHHFLQAARLRYALEPNYRNAASPLASHASKLEMANRFARRIDAVAAAKLMLGYRGKKSGAVFAGVRCDCCNTLLTNPESIAAGRGPKCMEDGKRPLAHFPAALRLAASINPKMEA